MVIAEVDARREELVELSLRIHANPELGLKETKASGWLAGYLESNGFDVERGICQLPTAFRASYGSQKPNVGILAEYDALPKLGHACGHNIVGTAAVGAGVATKLVIDRVGGQVTVYGTPAEELEGGKAIMANRGAFRDLDAAMKMHPANANRVSSWSLAAMGVRVEFRGKSVHASSHPEEGINALEALILSFNHINSLRQHVKEKSRIHGIITNGGEAANVVPDYAAGSFLVRAEDDAYLAELWQKVLKCFEAGALATGAQFSYQLRDVNYLALRTNQVMAGLGAENIRRLGREVVPAETEKGYGSTDLGNVSVLVPAVSFNLSIAPSGVDVHQPEFCAAAASDTGHQALLDGAKVIAMTAVDLLTEPEIMTKVKEEFVAGKG